MIFALQKGELVVAQTALVGSVLANALLVLGLVIVVGARRAHGRRHALLQEAPARHGDAAAGDGLHHRAARPLARRRTTRPATTSRRSRSSARSACSSSTCRGSCRTCAPTSRRRERGGGERARGRPARAGGVAGREARRAAAARARADARAAARRRRGVGVRLGLVCQRRSRRRSCSCTSPRRSPAS